MVSQHVFRSYKVPWRPIGILFWETTTPEPKKGPVGQKISSDKKWMKIKVEGFYLMSFSLPTIHQHKNPILVHFYMPQPNAWWLLRGLLGERIEKILLHDKCNEIFLRFNSPPWYSGQCSCLSHWMLGFNSPARQIFKLTFSPSPPVAITKPSS